MKKFSILLLSAIACFYLSCSNKRSGQPRVLVFTKNTYFFHNSIPAGANAIMKLGQENGFDVDTTSNADWITEDSLKKYAAVVFLNNADNKGELLNKYQEADFQRYIEAGGGYVGIHAASDAEYRWGWYTRLCGGIFNGHPEVQQATLNVADQNHPSTKHLPKQWIRKDEWYNFRNLNKDVHVLITIDENTYKGGTNGSNHPMAWYHEYDGGRAWFTALGHTIESYSEPDFLKHILGGIQYAVGDNTELDYSKAKAERVPDEDRFAKDIMIQGEFFEPTEMTILPNLDILIAQRRGELMLYKNDTKKVKQVGYLNVYWHSSTPGVNAEEGFMGLCKDPNYAKNNWVYMYYSPSDSSVNRLSRFTFKNDTLDLATEKVILEIKSQREICCHTGGSVAFGPDGLLYLSTGDNSTPFDEPGAKYVNSGFGPMNDLPGHQQYDARRSSGNTNDLRGKILRIRVKDDGTYEIPEGNLFPKGMEKTRPEIYVMGNRNPYRISVDQKNSYLYWGEVGPDAGKDSLDTRGPRGYDEVNQARKAGYFGWPLFVGNNYAYHAYDYANGVGGAVFDPQKPVNNSRNNTGLQELPPAQPAFIWYPYDVSPDFPEVGTGGRNAMAGPAYYTDMFPKETRLPDYYNGKLFIYDWIRGWIKTITLQPNGDFDKMESFMEHIKLSNCIDMEVGSDGRLYLLEYGTGWFSKNPDAGLSRIDYISGNRPPKIAAINVNKATGILPFTGRATVEAKDPENDKLTYIWNLGNGTKKETATPEVDFNYTTAGDYKISVEVKDAEGASAKSEEIDVYAGNETPEINIDVTTLNKSFYLPGIPVTYSITVTDKNDTSKFDPANLFVSVEYVSGLDRAMIARGHQQGSAAVSGKNIMLSLDCKSCHKENEVSIGPSFLQVGQKYSTNPEAMTYLTEKIIKGGGGVWGETQMSAHPTLPKADVNQIVQWILSLANKTVIKKSLPPSGTVVPPTSGLKPDASLVLSASYTDKGGSNIKALTGRSAVILNSNTVNFRGTEKMQGFTSTNYNAMNLMIAPKAEGWFKLDSIDLSGIRSANVVAGAQESPVYGYDFEIRLDAPDGKSLGKGSFLPFTGKPSSSTAVHVPLQAVTDKQYHAIYVVSKPKDEKEKATVAINFLQFNAK